MFRRDNKLGQGIAAEMDKIMQSPQHKAIFSKPTVSFVKQASASSDYDMPDENEASDKDVDDENDVSFADDYEDKYDKYKTEDMDPEKKAECFNSIIHDLVALGDMLDFIGFDKSAYATTRTLELVVKEAEDKSKKDDDKEEDEDKEDKDDDNKDESEDEDKDDKKEDKNKSDQKKSDKNDAGDAALYDIDPGELFDIGLKSVPGYGDANSADDSNEASRAELEEELGKGLADIFEDEELEEPSGMPGDLRDKIDETLEGGDLEKLEDEKDDRFSDIFGMGDDEEGPLEENKLPESLDEDIDDEQLAELFEEASVEAGQWFHKISKKKDDGKGKKPEAKVKSGPAPVFDAKNSKVTDDKDHFPIDTEAKARNALAQVNKYKKVPSWYSGSLEEMKKAVTKAVKKSYKDLEVGKDKK